MLTEMSNWNDYSHFSGKKGKAPEGDVTLLSHIMCQGQGQNEISVLLI